MMATWFQGPAAEFITVSRRDGSAASASCTSSADAGWRCRASGAVAQAKMTIM
jgi:hypothetical protein